MADEVELKFLDIHVDEMHQRLTQYGATTKWAKDIVSVSFDAPGYSARGADEKSFLRARQIGDEILLTHKGPNVSDEFKNRPETEITTYNSLDEAVAFLSALGFTATRRTQKHRTHYELTDTIHFEIDKHNGLPPYLEIETPTEEKMKQVCSDLGLRYQDGRNESITYIYPEHFSE